MGSIGKRKYRRYKRRVEVEFTAGGSVYKGLSSDLSEKGIFIRTRHALVPGTELSIKVYLPDGTTSYLKGIVRHAIKTPYSFVKNGMGVELTQIDQNFSRFFESHFSDEDQQTHENTVSQPEETTILICPSCNVKNRVKKDSLHLKLRCGRCGGRLN